jgi:hypothetical protein
MKRLVFCVVVGALASLACMRPAEADDVGFSYTGKGHCGKHDCDFTGGDCPY